MLGQTHLRAARETCIDLRDSEIEELQSLGRGSIGGRYVSRRLVGWFEMSNGVSACANLTPTQATSVPTALRTGTICFPACSLSPSRPIYRLPDFHVPLVTELSRLGLKASPEKKVRGFG